MGVAELVLCALYVLMFLLFNVTIKVNDDSLLYPYVKALVLGIGVIPASIGMLTGLVLFMKGNEDGLFILVAATMLEFISSSLLVNKTLNKQKSLS